MRKFQPERGLKTVIITPQWFFPQIFLALHFSISVVIQCQMSSEKDALQFGSKEEVLRNFSEDDDVEAFWPITFPGSTGNQ